MPTIAVVNDQRSLLTSASNALKAEGYRVATYSNGDSALKSFRTAPPDLAILDIKMPRTDGIETLRLLRAKSDLPVILLAPKEEVIDEALALKMGADDFIRKPCSHLLLVERVKAVLRRTLPKDTTPTRKVTDTVLECGLLRMDQERHTCTWRNQQVRLTATEFVLLHVLASRPGVVRSRNALLDVAYDNRTNGHERNIDSHIKRLRMKFTLSDSDFDMVETLYGVGYRYKEV
jgi:two-component system, OmpR family, response regulator ChvI